MHIWQIIPGIVVLFALALAVGVRLYPVDPAAEHVDPQTITPPERPNFVLLRGERAASHPAPVSDTAARLGDILSAEGAVLLAGDLAAGHASFLFRSRVMGFPDIVSIRLTDASTRERLPEGALTEIEIFARALIGYSDLGVNRARIERVLAALGT